MEGGGGWVVVWHEKGGAMEEGRQPSRSQDCQGLLQPCVDPGEGSAEGDAGFLLSSRGRQGKSSITEPGCFFHNYCII